MNIVQQFLAAQKRQQQTPPDDNAPITRAEFNALAAKVKQMGDNLDTATSPAKIEAAFNAAIVEAATGSRERVTNRARDTIRDYLLPDGAADDGTPLANKQGRPGFALPAGE